MQPREEDLVSKGPVATLGAEDLVESVPSEFGECFAESR